MNDDKKADIAVIGLAVMGSNLARNLESRGFKVAVYNRTSTVTDEFINEFKDKNFLACKSYEELALNLKEPKRVISMVKAGGPTDAVINSLKEVMTEGDIILDASNAWYKDTDRREAECLEKGINFLGVGVSGGEEGALKGPSIMPGGPKETWVHLQDILEKISAIADGPCVTYIGPGGSGHFVKMVHNGIEYADMQLLAESFHLLKSLAGFSSEDLSKTFECWNAGPLESYLVEITAKILKKNDEDDSPLVEKILDKAGQKGTGRWTAQVALELGVAIPMICEAVNARILSSRKEERVHASEYYNLETKPSLDKQELATKLENALVCAKVIAYAQGLKLIQVASNDFNWGIDISEVARIWKGGCIIRAKLLDNIQSAFKADPNLNNLLLQDDILELILPRISDLREVASLAINSGIPALCFSSAISYFDSYFTANLPQNLTQAQRDFFGAHTYKRIDKDGIFHTEWE